MDAWPVVDRLFRVSNFCGLSMVTFNRPEKKSTRFLYPIFTICCLTALIPVQILTTGRLDNKRNQVFSQIVCRALYNFGHLAGSILIVINSLRKRNQLSELLTDLRNLPNSQVKLTNLRWYLIIYCIFLVTVVVFDTDGLVHIFGWDSARAIEMVIEYIAMLIHMLVSLQFKVLVSVLSGILTEMTDNLNLHLNVLLKKSPEKIELTADNYIQRCRITYFNVAKQSKKLNRIFSTPNLWLMFFMTFVTTYCYYNRMIRIRRYLTEGRVDRLMFIFEMFFWMFYGILVMSVIITSCEDIHKKASKLKWTVTEHLVKAQSPKIVEELSRFTELLTSCKVKFAPHGLFKLRKKIALTIAGVSVTYMVIISQMPEKL